MRRCRVLIAFMAGAIIALPVELSAQPAPSSKAPRAKQQRTQPEPEYEVEELTPDQIRRAQEPQTPAQPTDTPLRGSTPASTATTPSKPTAAAPAVGAEPTGPARNIACSGIWSKDASHIKLANVFKLENVTFTDVPGPGATKVMATVVFPKDPKRRLEVWWRNETSRSGLYLIVINGQSTWSVPKGLKLGLGLAAIEKLNGKPFKLQGFGKDGGNTTDWDGGALAALPGGCKVGLKFAPDPKAPQAARDEVMVEREFESTDPAMRSARPSIAEIILGY
jgi:hypothetical protein